MEHDGSRPRRLTSTTGADRYPEWSPRQTQIVFVSERDGNPELYVIDADGSGESRLTESPRADIDPAWASSVRLPIGQDDMETDIAYASSRDGDLEIYLVKPNGSALRRLTQSAGADRGPQWSPDGSRIVFMSERDGNSEIYVMSADGSGQTRLTTNLTSEDGPSWSPDGGRIMFFSDRGGSRKAYSMRPDGTDQVLSPNQHE